MLWSSTSISGKPTILVVDASCNAAGWESEFCDRIFAAMKRRGLLLRGSSPVRVEDPGFLRPHLEPDEGPNCIFLLSHGNEATAAGLKSYWEWLNSYSQPAKLFASCTWESYDPELTQEILKSPRTFAPLALAQQSPLTPREAGLFMLKFFTEMGLHSSDDITGKMVWFSCSKARELLRRRRLVGKVGVRC